MNKLKNKIGTIFMLGMLMSWHPAQAQFAGDLFFANPSIAIPEGGQSQIELQAFMGNSTFGAVQLDLTYNPSELAILSVQPGTSAEVKNGFTFLQQEGVLSIIVLNGTSDSTPIGTVSLAFIEVEPLGTAGTIININSNVDSILRQDSTAFSFPNGFAMEIVVTSPLTSNGSSSTTNTASQNISDEVYQRALALRPEGSSVTVMVLGKHNNATATQVQTMDPSSPSE